MVDITRQRCGCVFQNGTLVQGMGGCRNHTPVGWAERCDAHIAIDNNTWVKCALPAGHNPLHQRGRRVGE